LSIHCYSKDKNLVARSIVGETLIIPVRSGIADLDCMYVLNEVGSRIWALLDERRPIDEIAEAIYREYEVSREQAASDLGEILRSLETAGLIHPAGEAEESSLKARSDP
jgi:coenzyme PQQ synthesis protein D (PqqD)